MAMIRLSKVFFKKVEEEKRKRDLKIKKFFKFRFFSRGMTTAKVYSLAEMTRLIPDEGLKMSKIFHQSLTSG